MRKSLFAFDGNRIAVRYQYEAHDIDGQWRRSYGNELWEFDEHGLCCRRRSSTGDVAIYGKDRPIFGPRPDDERPRGPTAVGLHRRLVIWSCR